MSRHFRLARSMALKSTSKFRLGAVLAQKSSIISTGVNFMKKTHPMIKRLSNHSFNIGIHAEIHACLGVDPIDLRNSEIYVYRVLKNGSPALAKPCKMCQTYLKSIGIKKAHYSTPSGYETLEFT